MSDDYKANVSLIFTVLKLLDNIESLTLWGWGLNLESSEIILNVAIFLGLFRL